MREVIWGVAPPALSRLISRLRRGFRRNSALYYVYVLSLGRARTERARARAVRGLGRAENPRAASALIDALDDPSLAVRREAAVALGKIRAVHAVRRLIDEMEDHESDIRSEAAEALGKIRDRTALSPLLRSLGDRDIRLRNAAVSALAALGGDEVREKLLELFVLSYDGYLFPTIAESLSRLGERSIVEPVMHRLEDYNSVILRLQLLNAVCRALGAGNEFYRILSLHEYARVDAVNRHIRRAERVVRRSPFLGKDATAGVTRILQSIAISYRAEDHRTFLQSAWEFMAYIQLVIPELLSQNGTDAATNDKVSLFPYIEAVNRFLILKETEDIRDEGMVFLVICIDCLLRAACHADKRSLSKE